MMRITARNFFFFSVSWGCWLCCSLGSIYVHSSNNVAIVIKITMLLMVVDVAVGYSVEKLHFLCFPLDNPAWKPIFIFWVGRSLPPKITQMPKRNYCLLLLKYSQIFFFFLHIGREYWNYITYIYDSPFAPWLLLLYPASFYLQWYCQPGFIRDYSERCSEENDEWQFQE